MSNRDKQSGRHRGTHVEVRNDDFNRALRTFSKKVQELGTVQEVKSRMFYESPAEERQRLKKLARKRWERKVEEMITNGAWQPDRNY